MLLDPVLPSRSGRVLEREGVIRIGRGLRTKVSGDRPLKEPVVEVIDNGGVPRYERHQQPYRDCVDRRASVVLMNDRKTPKEVIYVCLGEAQVDESRALIA